MSPPGDDDRRLPNGKRRIDERLGGRLNHGTRRGQKALAHAFGKGVVTTAKSGNESLQVLTEHCPAGCGAAHRFVAKPTFDVGIRTTPCNGLRFVLHVVVARQEAA